MRTLKKINKWILDPIQDAIIKENVFWLKIMMEHSRSSFIEKITNNFLVDKLSENRLLTRGLMYFRLLIFHNVKIHQLEIWTFLMPHHSIVHGVPFNRLQEWQNHRVSYSIDYLTLLR
ncbi:hypothetical protein D1970_21245 [Mesobacillus zeae]|uniref:Uncharacterized protein n=1 Tax=Mesobacillus zeae TaxID=1917180 RepID=A0A398AVH6_9BACI|nr:hypothetical protein D1970_21245 [Mesobacillus zeae]